MTRKTDYLFQPRDSRNWHIRLQGTPRIERSLGTSDRVQAEILALPLIALHKAKVLARRPRFETSWWHEFKPGRTYPNPEGGSIIATNRELIYLDAGGAIVKTVPNGAPQYTFPTRSTEPSFEAFDRERERAAPPPTKNGDDDLIETYLKHSGNPEGTTHETWAMFKQLCPGVKLADASRDDGRKLVAHLQAQGLKTATIRRRLVPLRAAVNLAIDEGKLKFNPFTNIVPKADDSDERLKFDDADMKIIRAGLDKLTASDRLLVTMLGATGMRLGEAFEITSEMKEGGVRYVRIGTKTEASDRRLPLPAKVLPLLPKAITGQLFAGNARSASVRLGRWLRKAGIADPNKTIHSFRHRAADRLRAVGCPIDKRWAILGHEKKSAAEGYGEGFPMRVLKPWADKIGF